LNVFLAIGWVWCENPDISYENRMCLLARSDFMTSEEMELSDQEKHEAALVLLRKLKDRLIAGDISSARLAALRLAWMQEDGLVILKEALFGKHSRTAKKAAAYGLRSMNGRMKKLGRGVLDEGLKHRDRTTKAACVKALFLMDGGVPAKSASRGKRNPRGNGRIQEIRRARRDHTERNRSPRR